MLRPPIVVVLGHVDHGKTTLLDRLRQTNITAGEPGGITQTIGAFKIPLRPLTSDLRPLTFIDTPGHEAFSKMRSRGAKIADIAVLVIAADDGVKPQTLESLSIIKDAKIPFIVVVNKIDLEDANPQKVKTELAKYDSAVEGFGGAVPVVEISAKTGKNLPELLEMINLVWELQQSSLQPPISNPQFLEAPIVDSRLDHRAGPVADIIIRQGILRLGDQITVDSIGGKVKAITDDRGQRVKQALPGDPVQVLGLKSVPPIGSILRSPVISSRFSVARFAEASARRVGSKPAGFQSIGQKPKTINVVLKADSVATLETLEGFVSRLPTPPPASLREALRAGEAVGNGGQDSLPELQFSVVAAGVGDIGESDILLADSSGAIIIGFRVSISKKRQKLAQNEGVAIINDNIIYRLLEKLTELEEPKGSELPPETGRAKIVKIFIVNGVEIAGCKVESGRIEVGNSVFLIKNEARFGPAKIHRLKFRAAEIKQAKAGDECGVLLESDQAGKKLKLSEGWDIITYQQ